MDDSVIAICATDGIAIVLKKSNQSDSQKAFTWDGDDPLLTKKIDIKWKVPTGIQKCEIKQISNNSIIIIIGHSENRKMILKMASIRIKNYLQHFNRTIPLGILCDGIANELNKNIGCNSEVILVSWDYANGGELYSINSDGNCFKYYANAIGGNKESIRSKLRSLTLSNLTTTQALVEALRILNTECNDEFEFKMMRICSESDGIFEDCSDEMCKVVLAKIKKDY